MDQPDRAAKLVEQAPAHAPGVDRQARTVGQQGGRVGARRAMDPDDPLGGAVWMLRTLIGSLVGHSSPRSACGSMWNGDSQ